MKEIDDIALRFYIIYKCFTHTHYQTLSPPKKSIDRTKITNKYHDRDCILLNKYNRHYYTHNN